MPVYPGEAQVSFLEALLERRQRLIELAQVGEKGARSQSSHVL